MKPFRERNPVMIGAISIVVLTAVLLAAFRADQLPVIGGGDVYYAAFAEAGGLQPGSEVRIAGVEVGQVISVELAGDHVRVGFRIETSSRFGPKSRAEIKVANLLGAMYMELIPAGEGQMDEGALIPESRTESPYSVIQAFEGLAQRSENIDTQQLAKAVQTLATLTENTPEEFQAAIEGLTRLSQNLAAKDERIETLLQNLEQVVQVLEKRDEALIKLMKDADTLFRALVRRRQAIHRLLVSTSQLSKQLTTLVRQSRDDLEPALRHLENVVDVLLKNQDNIDKSLRLLAPFLRVFNNTLGNGPWFDTYIHNIPPIPQLGGELPIDLSPGDGR